MEKMSINPHQQQQGNLCHVLKNFRVHFFFCYTLQTQKLTEMFTLSVLINAALNVPLTYMLY